VRVLVLVAAIAVLLAPAVARAGGVPVQVVAVGSTLWTVSDEGLLGVDPVSGRVVARPATPYPYAVRIAAGAGAVWVTSVANGYGSGAVTRIDGRTGRSVTELRMPRAGVYDVCAAGERAWAIVGRSSGRRVAVLGAGPTRFVRPPSEPAWCAAEAAGAWVSTQDGRLVHLPTSGAISSSPACDGIGQLAAGLGSVWAACPGTIARISERTRAVVMIPVTGIPGAMAVGPRDVWALTYDRRGRSRLVRVDPRSNRVTAWHRLAGSLTTVLEWRGSLWIGGLDRRRNAVLLRLDPRSLAVRRTIPLSQVSLGERRER
jgi:hypothetical protein